MAIATEPKPPARSHKPGTPRLARDLAERNESGLFDIHEDAITAMETLHALQLADLTPAQQQLKHDAFLSISAIARSARALEAMNTSFLLMKGDSTALNESMAKVDKAQKERKAGAK